MNTLFDSVEVLDTKKEIQKENVRISDSSAF